MQAVIDFIVGGVEVSPDMLVLIRLCLISATLQMVGNFLYSFRRL